MPLRETPRRRPRSGRTHRDDIALQPGAGAQRAVQRHAAWRPGAQHRGRSRWPWSCCGCCARADGGLAGLLGVAVAVVFFAAGLYVMKRVVGANPLSVLAGALAVYLGQIIFLGIIILVLPGAQWLDGTAFGLAILVGRAGLAGLPGGHLPADAPQRVRRAVRAGRAPVGSRDRGGEADPPAAGRAPGEGR